jgi:hypothetical protein
MHVPGARLGIGLLVVAIADMGCGSNDCTETATCDVSADGSAGGDVVSADATEDVTQDVTRDAGGRESGSGPGDDSGAASDSMALSDVGFVDAASCGTGSLCVDAVPAGWSGPLVLSDQSGGPPTPTPPACPLSYSNDAFDGYLSPTSPPAVCTCSCGPLSGLTCSGNIDLALFTDSACTSPCSNDPLPYASGGSCVATGCAGASEIATEPPAQGGACTPNGTSMNPPNAWAETARACQPKSVGGGCSGSQICVPSPPSPFSSKLCIMQAGSVSCPAGSYSRQRVFYASTQDTRSCAPACACAAPTNATCTGGAASVYTPVAGGMSGCATATSVPVDGQCHALGGSIFGGTLYAQATAPPSPPGGGSCAASSPQAAGMVTPSGPTTLCCEP